jgi:adenosylcobinamide-phosphate synthase
VEGLIQENALALSIAFLLDVLLADVESWPHPVRWMGAGYSRLEVFFKRRGSLTRFQGIVTVLFLAVISALIPFLILRWIPLPWLRLMLEGVLLYFCISVKGLSDEAQRIEQALGKRKIGLARKLLSRVVGRDTNRLNPSEVARAVVETLGESFVDGFLSPVFWALLFGAPGAFFFKAVSTGDSMIGHPEPPYQKFGWAAAKLDDALNWIPARLSPLVLIPAALFTGQSVPGLVQSFFKDRLKHTSPNAAHAEAAFAGALGVKLGGINRYSGQVYRQAFLNVSGRVCRKEDIHFAIRFLWAGAIVTVFLILGIGSYFP